MISNRILEGKQYFTDESIFTQFPLQNEAMKKFYHSSLLTFYSHAVTLTLLYHLNFISDLVPAKCNLNCVKWFIYVHISLAQEKKYHIFVFQAFSI